METGWTNRGEYFVVKPLKNGHRQALIMGACKCEFGRWNIEAGVFSSNITYDRMANSDVWRKPTSTNKNPSIKTLILGLEALNEIEQEIRKRTDGKKTYIYVDGLDERRLRVYTKVLTKRCGYKLSKARSTCCELPKLYKQI